MADDSVQEPDDIYRVRAAAHQCVSAVYSYLRHAGTLAESLEPPASAQFKGALLDRPEKTGAEHLAADKNDPLEQLELTVRVLVRLVDELITAHVALQRALEPIEEELAGIYPGLQNVSGFECRSHCKAVESFAWHVVRFTFDAIDRSTPEAEMDPAFGPDHQVPFTASNWHGTCVFIAEQFSRLDIEDRVHEAIEQELSDAWRARLALGVAPTAPGELLALNWLQARYIEANGKKCLVPADQFHDYLLTILAPVSKTVDACISAAWIEKTQIPITSDPIGSYSALALAYMAHGAPLKTKMGYHVLPAVVEAEAQNLGFTKVPSSEGPQAKTATDGPWSQPDTPSRWATRFSLSWDTLKKRFQDGTIRAKKLSSKSYQVHVEDLPSGPISA